MNVARPAGPFANNVSATLPQRFPGLFNLLAPCSSSAHPAAKLSANALKD